MQPHQHTPARIGTCDSRNHNSAWLKPRKWSSPTILQAQDRINFSTSTALNVQVDTHRSCPIRVLKDAQGIFFNYEIFFKRIKVRSMCTPMYPFDLPPPAHTCFSPRRIPWYKSTCTGMLSLALSVTAASLRTDLKKDPKISEILKRTALCIDVGILRVCVCVRYFRFNFLSFTIVN